MRTEKCRLSDLWENQLRLIKQNKIDRVELKFRKSMARHRHERRQVWCGSTAQRSGGA